MTREEAIKALEARRRSDDVVYVGDISYPEALSMAIEALMAQEPVEVTWRRGLAFCSSCGRQFCHGFKYCPDCGRPVKWA